VLVDRGNVVCCVAGEADWALGFYLTIRISGSQSAPIWQRRHILAHDAFDQSKDEDELVVKLGAIFLIVKMTNHGRSSTSGRR
jgi:hypothetical protein